MGASRIEVATQSAFTENHKKHTHTQSALFAECFLAQLQAFFPSRVPQTQSRVGGGGVTPAGRDLPRSKSRKYRMKIA